MKDYGWKIKVSDLLTNPGNTDNIKFEKKFLKADDISLGENGITGNIFLQGLNHDEILLKIKNLNFKSNYICDKCLIKYQTNYDLTDIEEVRFVNPSSYDFEENIYDNIFPIDMKNQNIDIENLIEIIVKNEEPIIKICEKCKNKNITDIEKNQEENLSYKIDFSKLLKS